MAKQKPQATLEQQIELFRDLLDKQRLVTQVTKRQSGTNSDVIDMLVHRQNLAELTRKLKTIHSADISDMLEAFPMGDRLQLWNIVKNEHGGEILLEVSDEVRSTLIKNTSETELLQILAPLGADDLSYIADDIPPDVLQQRQSALSAVERQWLHSSFDYREDEAGFWMSNEYVSITDKSKIADIEKQLRRVKTLPSHNNRIFITNNHGLLLGSISIHDVLLNEPETLVSEIMATDEPSFLATDDAIDVANAFERYDLVSAPVVNNRGKLIGRLTVDTIMDIIRDANNKEMLTMAGLKNDEDLFSPMTKSARNRIFWLIINLFTAFVASRIIGLFEPVMSHLIALAALMPVVASICGNTGNQTTALIIRGLAQGQVTKHNTWYLVRKELGIGFINGIALGLLVGIISFLFYQNIDLSLVMALAMLITMEIAALIGLSTPMMLHTLGKDPALGSSVILTATTDSVSFFIFLGLASLWLT